MVAFKGPNSGNSGAYFIFGQVVVKNDQSSRRMKIDAANFFSITSFKNFMRKFIEIKSQQLSVAGNTAGYNDPE